MENRKIAGIHAATYEPIGDLVTYRALPIEKIPFDRFDPFILLNHHGYQEYLPGNNGLPFGPHPHRGFETVTFILSGDLTHKDSSGGSSVISSGGVQWMTAGSGLIHAEVSSEEFKEKGGPLEILQLWVNLPSKYKMVSPNYIGLQQEEIPATHPSPGITLYAIAGNWLNVQGAISPLTDVHLALIEMTENAEIELDIPPEKNVLFYQVRGSARVNETLIEERHLIEFDHDSTLIQVKCLSRSVIIFGHATPFKEPIVSHGPFVMNSQMEIRQAYDDYQSGKFGRPDMSM